MAENKRIDIKRILGDPDLRRRLMVSTIQATQGREGIQTTVEQAHRAYYVVSEGERAAFFWLSPFRAREGGDDLRHDHFVSAIASSLEESSEPLSRNNSNVSVRFDVRRADFAVLDTAPLVYRQVRVLAPLFRENSKLGEGWANVRGGMNSTASDRFVRYFWEVIGSQRRWVRYSKGGSYARFYSDLPLVLDWTNDGAELRALVRERYGSESRFIKSPEFYFKRGLTWTEKSSLGLSVRVLEEGAIFNVAGPGAFPLRASEEWYLLGVLNSNLIAYAAWALSGRNYGADYVAALPVARAPHDRMAAVSDIARRIHELKASWDHGNESSTAFKFPWLLEVKYSTGEAADLVGQLSSLAVSEATLEREIQELYARLNDKVYILYGIPGRTRIEIEESLGNRPSEVLWPYMEGQSEDQKRMEHVWRLLSYTVKRVVEAEEEGIVPFLHASGATPLLDRVREELGKLLPGRDANEIEVEIVNELKHKVKGYERVESIREWLENVYFAYHASLYKNLPIFWHISSKQGKSPAAFAVLVHYHRFDKDRMAKVRGVYLREALGLFRREAAVASQAGRADDRLEWQAKVEEAEELDRRLQQVQEGFHQGAEDFRIRTPWKAESELPKGWDPDINDGVKVNIEPLQRAGVLRIPEVV